MSKPASRTPQKIYWNSRDNAQTHLKQKTMQLIYTVSYDITEYILMYDISLWQSITHFLKEQIWESREVNLKRL